MEKYREGWESAGTLRLPKPEKLLERIDKLTNNRQEWIRQAIREKLEREEGKIPDCYNCAARECCECENEEGDNVSD